MEEGHLNKVWALKVLKTKARSDEARKILERIAKQVQPIMRKHNWRVKLLTEMTSKKILGLNVGKGLEVKLMLRRHGSESEFLPFDQVLDTMLHELCHNAHGPHNASFYKLWDQLREECEELMRKGISGSGMGFDLPGRRLGGLSRQPPLSSLRKTTLTAAETRKKVNELLPSGPLRLGGDKGMMCMLKPSQAAAMAAERRLQDEIWCASSFDGVGAEEESNSDLFETLSIFGPCDPGASCSSGNHRSTAAEMSRKRDTNDYGADIIDLTTDVQDAGLSKKFRGSCISSPSSFHEGQCENNSVSSSVNALASGLDINHVADNNCGKPVMWICEACTLLNPPLALICEACETLKPKDASMKSKFWTCKHCTLENIISLEKCSACDQWRYTFDPTFVNIAS